MRKYNQKFKRGDQLHFYVTKEEKKEIMKRGSSYKSLAHFIRSKLLEGFNPNQHEKKK